MSCLTRESLTPSISAALFVLMKLMFII
jgi:hypothetical protein